MLALTMAFGLESTMIAVTQDLNKGVIDRFRSMPMANGAVLVGRSAADMLQSALGLTVMLAVGYAIGWRAHGGVAALLGAVGLLLLFRFAMLWIGIQLAHGGRASRSWCRPCRSWSGRSASCPTPSPSPSPCRAGSARSSSGTRCPRRPTAVRDLFGNPGGEPGHVWAAVAWPLALLAVFFPLAVRRFGRLSR